MGGYLSEPIREKESSDYEGEGLICGASSMQGWRATQEDAHNCYMKYDESGSLFAVYDGHGGHEVAEYAAKHLPNYIKGTDAYKAGDYEKALIDAFLGFDATLASPDVITVLKKIAGSKESDVKPDGEAKSKSLEMDEDDDEDDEDEEESLEHLRKEAHMPLDQLIDRYRQENKGNFKFVSPNCSRTKKAGGAGPSTSAAASSSCESNGADGEVSSSSGSSKVLTNGDIDVNGDISDEVNGESSEAGSSGDKCNGETAVKKTDAAGGGSSSSGIAASSSGSAKDDLPDSSSQSQSEDKNVSSSNGEVNDDKLSSSIPNSKEFGKRSVTLTRKLLCSPGEDSDSDSDDENFEGEAPESSDDDEDGGEVEGEEDEDDEECEEEEDEDDDDDEEGEEDIEFDYGMQHSDEPGSDSGCTAVVALLKGKDLFVANAGDSRCVVCRDGQAIEMSIDHKPEDQIEKDRIMAAGGKVSKDGRVNGGLNLSRALGDHTYKQVTTLPATEQMITALPDIKKLEIDPVKDEFIVLACDGIWNFMSSQDVVDFIRPRLNEKREKISTICEELFDHCLAPDTEGDGTGCDNMTCIIVQLKPVGLNGHESVKKRSASTLEEEEDLKDTEEEVSSKRQKIESEKTEKTAPEATPVTV